MLAANVCASDFLASHDQPCLYRVHEGPNEEKLRNLRSFLGEFGLGLNGGDDPKARDYAELLEKIKPRPDFQLLLLDCRSLEWRALPIPPQVAIVIADTSVRRKPSRSKVTELGALYEQMLAAERSAS